MKSEFRQCIIQNKVGLLSREQLVQIADTYIIDNDVFPDWVTKISLGESLEREPLLDLMLEPINEGDCKIIASEILAQYQKGELDTQKLGDISHKLYLSLEWGCEAFDKFIWISDEIDLIKQGYKSNSDLDANIEKVLGEVIAL
ncbi:hypothetical protein AB4526_11100 [Vibrio cyclitrophicus]